ncbi:MAG: hypothetical protein ACK59M_00385 [Pseudomonadota bacterium]
MIRNLSAAAAVGLSGLAQFTTRCASVFILNLPMKKRWLETQRCIGVLRESLDAGWVVRAKQLYHDREEVTVAVFRGD